MSKCLFGMKMEGSQEKIFPTVAHPLYNTDPKGRMGDVEDEKINDKLNSLNYLPPIWTIPLVPFHDMMAWSALFWMQNIAHPTILGMIPML